MFGLALGRIPGFGAGLRWLSCVAALHEDGSSRIWSVISSTQTGTLHAP